MDVGSSVNMFTHNSSVANANRWGRRVFSLTPLDILRRQSSFTLARSTKD